MNPNTPLTAGLLPNLTIAQACERVFNISRALYYKLPPDERPPTIRIGSKPFIRLSDALAWLAAREAK